MWNACHKKGLEAGAFPFPFHLYYRNTVYGYTNLYILYVHVATVYKYDHGYNFIKRTKVWASFFKWNQNSESVLFSSEHWIVLKL